MKKFVNSPLYLIVMLILCISPAGYIISIPMLIIKIVLDKKAKAEADKLKTEADEMKAELTAEPYLTYKAVNGELEGLKQQIAEQTETLQQNNTLLAKLQTEIVDMEAKHEKATSQLRTQTNKLTKARELYKSMEYAMANFIDQDIKFSKEDGESLDMFAPGVMLQLHCMDSKSLRKCYRDNDKQIDKVLGSYASRYTTKANRAIYQLMVIALRAELQNVLYNLKYEKLEKSIDDIKAITAKYLQIAGEGNQSIVGTLTKFIGEVEYLFINAVKIEYNYYVKREQAKQEQAALREQMRQEAEERKALQAAQKKVEQEEQKYNAEISKLQAQLSGAQDAELEKLQARILELQTQLSDVVVKKDEISKLQNGKAGNIYIISNLGAFGENVFKVGMTRRLNPQDRIDELGSASVPFKFDVHSFIFSNDAVALESKLHTMLNDKRVNKVNMRKEFFYSSIDELEQMVNELDPTAEFTRTMMAEEYRQSLSSSGNYTSTAALEEVNE